MSIFKPLKIKQSKMKRGITKMADHPWLIILIAILILLGPQLFTKGMIVGSDSIFHFNRFYETSQQIMEGNFEYFLSIYGFQQSGRIVNALYGPYFAYLQGLLVLVSPSWFYFQLFSNALLYVLAAFSMFGLLRKLKVAPMLSTTMSVFFITTYAIQYWIERQGFTAWGAALFPLCLYPLVDLVKQKKIYPLKVGGAVALMLQIHLLTTVFLVCVYTVCFGYILFRESENRKKLLKGLAIAIFVFFCLSANIIGAMIEIYSNNNLLNPFVNKNMAKNTITGTSSYWFTTPITLPLLFILVIAMIVKNWSKIQKIPKITVLLALFFTVISSNLIPWRSLQELDISVINIIQFPFRLFVPAIILMIVGFTILRPYPFKINVYRCNSQVLFVLISMMHIIGVNSYRMNEWNYSEKPIIFRNHTYTTCDSKTIADTLYKKDKLETLIAFQRSTPDYLPVYFRTSENNYRSYGKQIIENNHVDKTIKDRRLMLNWHSETQSVRSLPIIKYGRTQLILNGRILSDEEIYLSSIGVPSIYQDIGENKLIVEYLPSKYFVVMFKLSLVSWISMIVFFFF